MSIDLTESRYDAVQPDVRERYFSFARQFEFKTLIAQSLDWRYLALGPKNGPPVLFFAGGVKHPIYSFAVIDTLASRCRVIAPAQPPCHTLTEFFGGIDAILSAESIDRFAVCGSSWGGQVAQVAMLRYGDRVERAVLSSTGMSVGRFLSFVLKMYRRSIARKHPEAVVVDFRKRALRLLGDSPEAGAFWTAVFDDLYEKTMSFDDYLTLIDTQIDYVETYGPELVKYRFPNPVLILRARDETAGSRKMITVPRRAYPHAQEYQFDAGGHHPALFHAVEYRQVVQRFLTGDAAE